MNFTSLLFIATTLLAVYLFYRAANFHRPVVILLIAWLLLQAGVAFTGFYENTAVMPPRFLLLVLPPLAAVIYLLVSSYKSRFSLAALTLLHIVRIPVELVLHQLYLQGKVPANMTFEGNNFDIISGVTAPFIWYYGFVKPRLHRGVVVAWNVVCLALLANIVVRAVLSAPTPFQRLGFEQPNVAVLQFPYVWLPGCVVPLVLLAHLVVLVRLFHQKK
ncbi:hypothetical protein [uncultured Chitinophaga sp.]|uniref:hypothetical protein n=1 Tax=uncultured Chitinophaga sp. TaxID=339340 RepID=UPI0025E9BF86|nr:hypothetical protein [uncultured Chitinophaga sp.]